MKNLTPSMRLKVNRDTFFLPEPNGGVYFRNNVSSFRMEGRTIVQWIEQLIPMFNGEHALSDLTDGLPGPYRNRVMEIAEVLYKNGFVRDISQDAPHQLTDRIVDKYASQIAFLDSVGDSGARRFQDYRQLKVLAIGSGPFFVSLVSALLESGLPAFHIHIKDSESTNRKRLKEIVAHFRTTDEDVVVEEVSQNQEGERAWQEIIRPYDYIVSVSQDGEVEELRALHAACRQEEKMFFPALSLNQIGLAGPMVNGESLSCWESAWRRLHQSSLITDQEAASFSSTAGALLANVLAFELFKRSTGVSKSDQSNQLYLLDMETLEGSWHTFLPHPFVTGTAAARWVTDFDLRLNQQSSRGERGKLFMSFGRMTSSQSGIFHSWEEGELKQLPLAQCRVQVVDPMSEGPAELLQAIICSELLHEEARREAGLTGVEAYATETVSHLGPTLPQWDGVGVEGFVGVGTGETFAECMCRGLYKCLDEELTKRSNEKHACGRIQLEVIDDERCRYYLQALTRMAGDPVIALGEEVFGFPVVWVGTGDEWYGCVGLNSTQALRNALQQALMAIQNEKGGYKKQGLKASSVLMEKRTPLTLRIASYEESRESEVLQEALQVLDWNGKRLLAFELELEPVLKEELAGVFGVLLREEGSR
ncbi:putative thiazole-containing bacteriocin maturation protein [Peribacillus sp. NPDC097284]|uniref:putative thiazole-containing bacteriocin maturation protein n=1 Tax=Peribacillus sp. NPDC097284 TaxID=3364401 RepID=UPI0037F9B807